MRYSELFERRRGGDLNPRQSSIDIIKALQNYSSRGGEYYYISYTAIDKLGINPRSGYNTPVGIYCYPLVTDIMDSIERRGLSNVPYMGEMPYIWLFRPRNIGRGLIIDEYRSRDLESDRAKLFNFVNGRNDRITSDVFEKIVLSSVNDSSDHSPAGYIWNLTRILSLILVGDHKLSRYTTDKLKVGDTIKYKGEIGVISDVYSDSDEYRVEFSDGSDEYISFDDSDLVPYDGSDLVKYDIGDTVRIKSQSIRVGSFVKLSDGRIGEVLQIDNGSYDIATKDGIQYMVSGKDVVLKDDYSNKTGIITNIYPSKNPLKTYYVVEIKIKDEDGFEFTKTKTFNYDDIEKYDEKEENEKLSKLKFSVGDLARLSNPKAPKRYRIISIDFEKDGVMMEPMNGSNPPFFWPFSRLYKGNPEYAPDVTESIILEYKTDHVGSAKSGPVMWAYMLNRVLGYEYVDDSSGSGLIHGNEPVQAVFFGRNTVDVVDRFINPSAKKNSVNSYELFSGTKSPEEIEKTEQSVIKQFFLNSIKSKTVSLSSNIPQKFRKHIVLNSSKLKARVILKDFGMADYFKTVDDATIKIMDKHIINKIYNLERGNTDDYQYDYIWRYFNHIRGRDWSEGEKAIISKANNDRSGTLILNYLNSVKQNNPLPNAEFIILKDPKSIPGYAGRVLKRRWPEGERVLSRLDPQRAAWVLEEYAYYFGISVKDIGNINK